MFYKPETLEENLANIKRMKDDFWWNINYIYQCFLQISREYECNKRINYLEATRQYERQMQWLVYGILGFTLDTYERLSYAIDYWRRMQNERNQDNASDKQFDQTLKLLVEKKKITGEMKRVMLQFRLDRNYAVHYGRLIFIDYVIKNRYMVYQFVEVVFSLLIGYSYNEIQYQQFIDKQTQFIQDMKEVFSKCVEPITA